MTRRGIYTLTAVSVLLFIFLNWAFADGLFALGDLWLSDDIMASTIFTYIFIAVILLAGYMQASRTSDEGEPMATTEEVGEGQIDDPKLWKLLLGNVHLALIWLPLRFFVGREWAVAGEHKLRDSAWMDGGVALQGYWERVTAVPDEGRPAITYGWFREFLNYMLENEWYTWFAKLIAIGEFAVGIALIIGAVVGLAAFFGTVMNFSFMLAGSASSNPVLFGLGVFLVLAWKVAGYFGVDRYLLPILGAPWSPGKVFGGGGTERQTRTPSPA